MNEIIGMYLMFQLIFHVITLLRNKMLLFSFAYRMLLRLDLYNEEYLNTKKDMVFIELYLLFS